jgi:hypothetical protein
MMKILTLAILFFSVSGARAADTPINLTCITEVPSTSFVIWTEGKDLFGRVIYHFGSRFAPAINGIYTPNDLGVLAERASLVEKMQDVTTFRWPLSKCRRHDEFRFECFGTDDVQEGKNGEKLTPFALYTTRSSEDGIGGKWEYLSVTLTFQVDGKGDPSVQMKYPKDGCIPSAQLDI